ncbi:uncharacterized protein LOC131301501 [Rhododendron vialii]|uniref:uncharacterized protein LOC131301501 n=1 Tax=Rhododendron vialii TaxID=182163 RepID=UPI00265F90F2|nr:uncharacterized protein LOC131301501 [Rhododendron vialii]
MFYSSDGKVTFGFLPPLFNRSNSLLQILQSPRSRTRVFIRRLPSVVSVRASMSLLNQLFSRGILGAKCKTCLTLAISRMKLLQNKRDMQLKLMRKEIAQFLQAGQEPIAQIRVEHVIREQNIWSAYEILELFCEFILARVPILDGQRECPSELLEAVASIIFAAPRCSDVPDLLHVRNLFAAKYGKEFTAGATELRPDTSVNRTIIEKLSVTAPSAAVKLKVLKDVAEEYNVEWDSSKTEAEFSKKPEDLLNGPKQVYGGPALSQAPAKHGRPEYSTSIKAAHPTISAQRKEDPEFHQSPSPGNITSLLGQDGVIKSTNRNENPTPANDLKRDARPQSSEILEKARTAIAAAERATATARAAAQLANVKFGTPKLEEQKS